MFFKKFYKIVIIVYAYIIANFINWHIGNT